LKKSLPFTDVGRLRRMRYLLQPFLYSVGNLERYRRRKSAIASDIWRPSQIAVTTGNFRTGSAFQFKTK